MIVKNDYDSYFFNNLYNDELIGDKLASFQNRLYNPILKGKEWIQNNRIINGDIFDVKINQDLNMLYKLPLNSYSLQFNRNIVPFYSEKGFFTRYGYGKVISSTDIMNDCRIFDKNFYFFLGGYLIHDVKLVIFKDKCIIFIVPTSIDNPSDICKEDIDEIIDSPETDLMWTVMLTTKADYYTTTLPRASLFKGNKIYLDNFPTFKRYSKPYKSNCWTLYVSGTGRSYNIMSGSNVSLQKDDEGEYFLISDEFKNYIYAKANTLRCLVINEPECSGTGIYVDVEGSNPIFQIPFKKNPIPKRNLIVWEYDNETKRKLHPLEVSADLLYPNIYDFTEMLTEAYLHMLFTKSKKLVLDASNRVIVFGKNRGNGKFFDLYIEWIEPMQDVSAYDSYIQDYMDCYKDIYAANLINGKLPQEIKDYHPIVDPKLGAFDYLNSEYKGDYRAWRLTNLIKLLKDNPTRYDELFHMLYYYRKEYITRTYSFKTESHIYDRNIVDNKNQCDNAQELLVNFDQPQCFVRFFDYHYMIKPVGLFFDGKFNFPTYVMRVGTTLFVYFDSKFIMNHETIQMDVELVNNPQETRNFFFPKSDSSIDLEDLEFNRKVSLSNIIFYDVDTGEYLTKDSDLTFKAQISIADISYIGMDKVDTTSELNTEMVLATKNGELVTPNNYDCIVLKVTRIKHEISDPESNQLVDLDNVQISLNGGNSLKYVRKGLGAATTDFYQQKVFTIKQSDLIDNKYSYVYMKFVGKPDKNRFRIYVNGLRLNPNKYDISFKGFCKDAVIDFHSGIPKGEYIIQYMGYDEIVRYNGQVSGLKKTSDNILYLRDILDTPFDPMVYKIFIDGYRISDDQIKLVGQSNMIMINPTYYPFTDSSEIVIYQQKMDEDLYEFKSDSQFLDKTSIEDETFRHYLIEKYK